MSPHVHEEPDEGRLVVRDGLPVRVVRRLPEETLRDRVVWLTDAVAL